MLRNLEMEKAKRDAEDGQLSLFGPDMTPLPHLDEKTKLDEKGDDEKESFIEVVVNPIHDEILDTLSSMQLDDYSPFEALQALYQMQNKLKRDSGNS